MPNFSSEDRSHKDPTNSPAHTYKYKLPHQQSTSAHPKSSEEKTGKVCPYDSCPTPILLDTFLEDSILPRLSSLAASGFASSYGNDVSRCSSISYCRKNFC